MMIIKEDFNKEEYMDYTLEQLQVINTKNKNLLVAAAAGAGKTAVLVERIIRGLISGQLSLENLLMVTFTRAASAEMRSRISQALYNEINTMIENGEREKKEKEIKRLKDELILLPASKIMTLHAFCLEIIRDNYHLLGIGPTFRIASDLECQILSEKAIKEVLEEAYQEESPVFYRLIDSFETDKSNLIIESMILNISNYANKNPWPKDWLYSLINQYKLETKQDFYQGDYFKFYLDYLSGNIVWLNKLLNELNSIIYAPNGASKYLDQYDYYKNLSIKIEDALTLENYNQVFEIIKAATNIRISNKTKGMDKELIEMGKLIVNNIRKIIDKLQCITPLSIEKGLSEIKEQKDLIELIVDLALAYLDNYKKHKLDKGLIDFSDIEHLALNLLYQEDNGQFTYSEIAYAYKNKYREILIDEYQDTNGVQEAILMALASDENPNLIMVGDIKQSIYGFRLTRPKLFQERYDKYSAIDALDKKSFKRAKKVKIDLSKNFRSTSQVLDFVNKVFEQTMHKEAVGIDYDEKARLYCGSTYYEASQAKIPKILIADKNDFEDPSSDDEIEAGLIAREIVKLVSDKTLIYDKNQGYRPLDYGDICILLRSGASSIDTFVNIFKAWGIPVLTDTYSGYFETVEVSTIINLLKIIDNPLLDIPLLAVLRSPLVSMDENDLAYIKIEGQGHSYFEKLLFIQNMLVGNFENKEDDLENEENDLNETHFLMVLKEKINSFFNLYWDLDESKHYKRVCELIERIYNVSNYDSMVALMENGKQRKLNLDFLINIAIEFEEFETTNISNFLTHIDKIKKLEVAYGQPVFTGNSENMVKIMTIHKSKGLEFPLVFLARANKAFNLKDTYSTYLIDMDLGLAMDYINLDIPYKKTSFYKEVLREKLINESISEELRILYVALTRARESLYITATVKDKDKFFNKYQNITYEGNKISKNDILASRSFLDFIMPVLYDLNAKDELDGLVSLKFISPEKEKSENDFLMNSNKYLDKASRDKNKFIDLINITKGENKLKYDFYKPYPHLDKANMPMHTSVTALKESKSQIEKLASLTYKKTAFNIDTWISKDKASSNQGDEGMRKGTIYHLIFEKIPFTLEKNNLDKWLKSLINAGFLNKEDLSLINKRLIEKFMDSDLMTRLRQAEARGQLKREQPFISTIKYQDDFIMIQGVIDLFFIEDGQIVIVDYKSDSLANHKEGDELSKKRIEKILFDRYKFQLETYKNALEDICSLAVKEVYIYSVFAGYEIALK